MYSILIKENIGELWATDVIKLEASEPDISWFLISYRFFPQNARSYIFHDAIQ